MYFMKTVIFLFFIAFVWLGCENQKTQVEISTDNQTAFYYHNLLFQWKDSVDNTVKNKMLDLLKGIPDQIHGFESITFHELEPGVSTYNLLVIQKYTSKKAEEMYQTHPDHLKAKSMGPQLIQKMTEFDYWDDKK